jgi:hypothetical protein
MPDKETEVVATEDGACPYCTAPAQYGLGPATPINGKWMHPPIFNVAAWRGIECKRTNYAKITQSN